MATTTEYPLMAGASCSDTRKDLTPINGISALYRLFSCNKNKKTIYKAVRTERDFQSQQGGKI